jgi:hypothetical protein
MTDFLDALNARADAWQRAIHEENEVQEKRLEETIAKLNKVAQSNFSLFCERILGITVEGQTSLILGDFRLTIGRQRHDGSLDHEVLDTEIYSGASYPYVLTLLREPPEDFDSDLFMDGYRNHFRRQASGKWEVKRRQRDEPLLAENGEAVCWSIRQHMRDLERLWNDSLNTYRADQAELRAEIEAYRAEQRARKQPPQPGLATALEEFVRKIVNETLETRTPF